MRNDVTKSLKETAEQLTRRPVKGILQRGSAPRRYFEVWFEDGTHTSLYLPKPYRAQDRLSDDEPVPSDPAEES